MLRRSAPAAGGLRRGDSPPGCLFSITSPVASGNPKDGQLLAGGGSALFLLEGLGVGFFLFVCFIYSALASAFPCVEKKQTPRGK